MARLPVLVRRSKVFDLVVAGKSHADICRQLGISEDTIARDMQAVGSEVQALCRERASELLAIAVAHLLEVIDSAWRDYRLEARREREWLAGKLDFPTLERATKSLGVGDGGDKDDEDADAAAAEVSAALEIKEKRGRRRPGWRSNKAKYLEIVTSTTRELTQLVGLQKIVLEHQGKGGGPIEVNDVARAAADQELAEWRRQQSEKLLSMQSLPPMPPTSSTPAV